MTACCNCSPVGNLFLQLPSHSWECVVLNHEALRCCKQWSHAPVTLLPQLLAHFHTHIYYFNMIKTHCYIYSYSIEGLTEEDSRIETSSKLVEFPVLQQKSSIKPSILYLLFCSVTMLHSCYTSSTPTLIMTPCLCYDSGHSRPPTCNSCVLPVVHATHQ